MDSTNLKQIDGGNIIISGDVSSIFSYQLQDENYKSLTLDGTAVVTLVLKSDRNPYMREEVAMSNGIVSFQLPILKSGSYQVSIDAGGYIFPSNGATHIMVEPNPGEGILETVGPLTLDDYLGDYALKSDIPSTTGLATETYVQDALAGVTAPNLDDYAKKVDVPTVVGLATEVYVDNHIADSIGAITAPDLTGLATELYVQDQISGLTAPDLTGYATETYVNDTVAAITPVSTEGLATEVYVQDQIAAIPLPEPVDTSNFITKPLTYPILATDPASKDYVDDAVSGLTGGGGGTTEGGSWTTIASGEYDSFTYNAYRYMIDNGFSKFRVMVSINSDATEFNLNFRHAFPTHSIISEYLNLNSKMSTNDLIWGGNVHRNGGKAYVVIDYEFLTDPFLDLGDSNATMTVSIYSNEFALLSTVSGSTPSFNYVPNFKRLINLRSDQYGESILSCNGFVGQTFKKVKGIFKGYK